MVVVFMVSPNNIVLVKICQNSRVPRKRSFVIYRLLKQMSEPKTDSIVIVSRPQYVPERSDPSRPIYFFSYNIVIKNNGTCGTKLLNRYWHITDGNGNIEEVRGPGVVGHQPHIKVGETFEYTSFCPLQTAFGVMQGHYEMIDDNGKIFNAPIDPFQLAAPFSVN